MLALLNDILDISKIEAGKLEIETIEFDGRKLLDEIIVLLAVQAEAKAILLKIIYEKSFPETINSDPVRIRQIFFNLVGNAIKFTNQGSVQVRVAFTSGQLIINIEDTCIGISEKDQAHLFETFYQGETSASRKYGGTGLGLSISKRLIDLLGGQITVASQLGEGSQFSIRIPIVISGTSPGKERINYASTLDHVAPTLKNDPSIQEARPSKPQTEGGSTLRILLVEDKLLNQVVTGEMLKLLGCPYDLAKNGQDAVEMAFKQDYSLILMDCHMPVMDGFEATREIRRLEALNPDQNGQPINHRNIVALTADALLENEVRCLASGMDRFLSKPLRLELLQKMIHNKELLLGDTQS